MYGVSNGYITIFGTDFTSLSARAKSSRKQGKNQTLYSRENIIDDTLSSFFPCFATLLRYALNYVLNVLAQPMYETNQK